MPPSSSQPSSSSSPTVKRKQQSISKFFQKKPPSAERSSSGNVDSFQEANNEEQKAVETKNGHSKTENQAPDDEDEDIAAPAPKRAKTSAAPSVDVSTYRSSPGEDSTLDAAKRAQPNGGQRTAQFQFANSTTSESLPDEPDGQDDEGDKAREQKNREKLHQQFVKRLGGPDCLIGIGRTGHSMDGQFGETVEDAAEGGDEEEEERVQSKGKAKSAPKKGGSKLTPMEKQVIEIKRKHMDTILVVEVGYKFRFFGEDARVAAKELSIVCIPGKYRFDDRKEKRAFSSTIEAAC